MVSEMTRNFIFLVLSVLTALLLLKPVRCQRRLGNPCGGAGELVTTIAAVRHIRSQASYLHIIMNLKGSIGIDHHYKSKETS